MLAITLYGIIMLALGFGLGLTYEPNNDPDDYAK